MPDIVEGAEHKAEAAGGKIKELLTKKVGPLPVWAYLGIGVGALILLRGRGGSGGDASNLGSAADYGSAYNPFSDENYRGVNVQADVAASPSGSGDGATTGGTPVVVTKPTVVNGDTSSGTTPEGKRSGTIINIPGVGPITVPFLPLTRPFAASGPGIAAGNAFLTGPNGQLLPVTNLDEASKVLGGNLSAIPGTGYVGVAGSKESVTNVASLVNGFATIPGLSGKTQGETIADFQANSRAIIDASPNLQAEIARANVTAEQRDHAMVGPGGILLY